MPVDSTPEDLPWTRLAQYWAGECTPAEAAAVEAWLAADPERERAAHEMRAVWDVSGEVPTGDHEDAVWRTVRARLDANPTSSRILRITPAPRRFYRSPLVGIAATAIVAVGMGYVLGIVGHASNRIDSTRTYTTALGERKTVTLADGTRITLAPGSRLGLAGDYGARGRVVSLDGEGYFSVVHDVTHPFTVQAHGAVITDVGTEFDVRDYAADPNVRVAVAEGQVVVGVASLARPTVRQGTTALHPGDIAVVQDTTVVVSHYADVADLTSWQHGALTFHNTPLAEAVVDLSRWFGVEVKLSDPSLGARRVTATVTDEPLTEALDLLAPAFGTTYERQGTTVVLHPVSK